VKCGYCNRGFHPEHACMKKTIDQMAHTLQQNNLGGHIPENARKKDVEKPPDDRGKGRDGHDLVVVSSSSTTWILDSGASNHMASSQDSFTSLEPCTRSFHFNGR
jgi:hypothetical protein